MYMGSNHQDKNSNCRMHYRLLTKIKKLTWSCGSVVHLLIVAYLRLFLLFFALSFLSLPLLDSSNGRFPRLGACSDEVTRTTEVSRSVEVSSASSGNSVEELGVSPAFGGIINFGSDKIARYVFRVSG